jgi:signal transduction histidine kinase
MKAPTSPANSGKFAHFAGKWHTLRGFRTLGIGQGFRTRIGCIVLAATLSLALPGAAFPQTAYVPGSIASSHHATSLKRGTPPAFDTRQGKPAMPQKLSNTQVAEQSSTGALPCGPGQAPWYRTGWAYLISLLAVTGSAATTFFRLRKRQAAHRAQKAASDLCMRHLNAAGEAGRTVLASLDFDAVQQLVHAQLYRLLEPVACTITLHNIGRNQLETYRSIKGQASIERIVHPLENKGELDAWQKGWQQHLNDTLSQLHIPLRQHELLIGVICVEGHAGRSFTESEVELLQAFSAYAAIAIDNARAHTTLVESHRQLIESQQHLILQEKMICLGTVTAGVAHEINNPINFAHVASQNLRGDLKAFEAFLTQLVDSTENNEIVDAFTQRFTSLGAHIDTILSGTERIKSIVRDLRTFTRHDEAEKKIVRLSECLNSTVHLAQANWHETVDFITEYDDDPELECWPALLNQVFMNIVLNGCQAIAEKRRRTGMTRRGRLHIGVRRDGSSAKISFEDEGVGMDRATQARILEPFYTTRAIGEGSGLGLSTAYGILRKHRGELSFYSTPCEGTCFIISLPLSQSPSDTAD